MDLFFIWLGRQEAELFGWLFSQIAHDVGLLLAIGLLLWYFRKGQPKTVTATDVLSTTVRVQSAAAVAQVDAAEAQARAAESQIKASEALLRYLSQRERRSIPELALLPSVSYDRNKQTYRFALQCVGRGLALQPAWAIIPVSAVQISAFLWPEQLSASAKWFGSINHALHAEVDWSMSVEVPAGSEMVFLANYRDLQHQVHQSQLVISFRAEDTRSEQGFASITAEELQRRRPPRSVHSWTEPPIHAPWTNRASDPQGGPFLVSAE